MANNTKCLVCDMRGDHETEDCPYVDSLFEDGPGIEQALGDRCDGCGEREDPARPNAGDGWAEMASPDVTVDEHFTGHYQCGLARGLELA